MNKRTLILGIAIFVIGWLCPRPDYNKLLFLIKHPFEYFNYELNETSFELFARTARIESCNEIELLKVIEEYAVVTNDEFIIRRKKRLMEHQDIIEDTLSEMSEKIKMGGDLYAYSYKDGIDGDFGVLILKGGNITCK